MKNKSPVKTIADNKSGNKTPIMKAKNVLKQISPKSPKSPKPQKANGVQNGSSKKVKLNKVPVMNEASDSDSDSAATNGKVAKFGGTAALVDEAAEVKKGKKNKRSLGASAEEEKAVPAKKAKEDKKKVLLQVGAKTKKNKNRKRCGLIHTIAELMHAKDLEGLEAILPLLNTQVSQLKEMSGKKETITAKRKLRMLLSYEKRIKSGKLEVGNAKPFKGKKQKNKPRVPKGMPKVKQAEEEDDDEDAEEEEEEEETWQAKIAKVGSDDDEEDESEEDDDEEDDEAPKPKQGKKLNVVKKAEDKHTGKDQPKTPKKSRYVLFVGNLSYETSEEDIKKHFEKAGNIVDVRLGKNKDTNKSKGFCHLEFDNEVSYQKGLSMHHTQLAQRQINVMVSENKNQKSPQGAQTGSKRNTPKVKDMKLKGMASKGLLAGSSNKSQKRKERRNKAAAAKGQD